MKLGLTANVNKFGANDIGDAVLSSLLKPFRNVQWQIPAFSGGPYLNDAGKYHPSGLHSSSPPHFFHLYHRCSIFRLTNELCGPNVQ